MSQPLFALIQKDLLLELRQKHVFYGILLYVASTVFVIYLSLPDAPSAEIWNTLFWVIQLFVCINAVARSFLSDSRGRMLYYYTLASPREYILSKLIYNMLLMGVMCLITLGLFFWFLGNPTSEGWIFMGIVLLGGIGLSLVFTLMSAIVAKAQQNASLVAILGFPVILPQLLILVRMSKLAFAEIFREGALLQMVSLTLLSDVLVVALAWILFPFLWKE